jgi:hypothetical protein
VLHPYSVAVRFFLLTRAVGSLTFYVDTLAAMRHFWIEPTNTVASNDKVGRIENLALRKSNRRGRLSGAQAPLNRK